MIELEPYSPGQARWTHFGPSLVVVAGSEGDLEPLLSLLADLPPNIDAAVIVVLERAPHGPLTLDRVIQRRTQWPVRRAAAGDTIQRGVIYIAPHDGQLRISSTRRFEIVDDPMAHAATSNASPILESASDAFGARVVAVVLNGVDAADGVEHVIDHGGHVIVQDSRSTIADDMSPVTFASDSETAVQAVEEIASAICLLVARR